MGNVCGRAAGAGDNRATTDALVVLPAVEETTDAIEREAEEANEMAVVVERAVVEDAAVVPEEPSVYPVRPFNVEYHAFTATGTLVRRVFLHLDYIHLNALWSVIDTDKRAKITLQKCCLEFEESELLYRLEDTELTLNCCTVVAEPGDYWPSAGRLLSSNFLRTLKRLDLQCNHFSLPTSFVQNLMDSPIQTVSVAMAAHVGRRGAERLVFPAVTEATNDRLEEMALCNCVLVNASSLVRFRGLRSLVLDACKEARGEMMANWSDILSLPSLRNLVLVHHPFPKRLCGALTDVLQNRNKTFDRLELAVNGKSPSADEHALLTACRTSTVTRFTMRPFPGKFAKTLIALAAQGRTQLELVDLNNKEQWLPKVRSVLQVNTDLLTLDLPWKDTLVEHLLARNRRLAIVASGMEGLWAPALARYQSGNAQKRAVNGNGAYSLLRWGWVTAARVSVKSAGDQNGDS